jgi:hypothetical protein
MTAAKQRVALVSAAGEVRSALAGYLRSAGFDVHECEELGVPSSFAALIVLSDPNAPNAASDQLREAVRSWIKVTKSQRVVVVTSRPTAFKDLLAVHGERLHVLPAPAFGWDLVDALRAAEPTRPRGA